MNHPAELPVEQLPALLAQARAARDSQSLDEGRRVAQAAWALARQARAGAEQTEAGFLLCLFQYRLGALTELLDSGAAVLPLLVAPEQRQQRCELLRWMCLAGCDTGRFDAALGAAQEVVTLGQQADDAITTVLGLNSLAGCLERMGDPWQAERLLSEALPTARATGDPFVRLATLNNLSAITIGAFYLLRGSDDRASADAALRRACVHAREALALLPELPDPFYAVFIEGNLGEALLHLGEIEPARDLLQRSLDAAQARGHGAQAWRLRCSLAELLLAEAQAEPARRALTELLHDMADADQHSTRVRAHHALYRAHRQLGQADAALAQLEHFERLERKRATSQLQAQSQLFVTRLEVEQSRLRARDAENEAMVQRRRAARFEAHAQQDELTGLGNRRQLDQRLPGMVSAAQADGGQLTLALLDLDHFKQINDCFGHPVGDQVLVGVAQLLRENTRGNDALTRMGGEEFLVVFPETTLETALEVCERLRQRVEAHPWHLLQPGLQVTLSIGLASAPPFEPAALIRDADQAMYRAKRDGRNRIVTA